MSKTDSDGATWKCSGAFVGQGGAVQARPNSDPPAAQFFSKFLAIPFRQEGYGGRLMISGKDPEAYFL